MFLNSNKIINRPISSGTSRVTENRKVHKSHSYTKSYLKERESITSYQYLFHQGFQLKLTLPFKATKNHNNNFRIICDQNKAGDTEGKRVKERLKWKWKNEASNYGLGKIIEYDKKREKSKTVTRTFDKYVNKRSETEAINSLEEENITKNTPSHCQRIIKIK